MSTGDLIVWIPVLVFFTFVAIVAVLDDRHQRSKAIR